MQLEPAQSEDFGGAEHAGKTLDSGQPRWQNLPKETEKSESIDSAANRIETSEDLTGRTLVVVNAPNPLLFMGLPASKAYRDESLPQRTRLLAPGFRPLKITRTGDKTLLVEAQTGNIMSVDTSRKDFKPNLAYFYNHFNSLFRPQDMPFEVGQKTELRDISAEVAAIDADGQPTKVLFEFAVSLDDPSLVWFQWTWKNGLGSYSKFEIPAIGQESRTNGPFDDA